MPGFDFVQGVCTNAPFNHHCYWLLDQSALPAKWLRGHVAGRSCVSLLSTASEASFDDVTPVLVAQPAQTAQDFQSLARLNEHISGVAAFANAVALLVSPLSLHELQRALNDRVRVRLPGALPAILRLFDTRTLPLLPQLLFADQYGWLHAPMAGWHYMDRDGHWQTMPQPAQEVKVATVTSLVLNETQEAQLVADGLADAVVDVLISAHHPEVLSLSPPEQHRLVAPLVDSAVGYGLDDPPSASAFVVKALALGQRFDQQAPWANLLAQVRAQTLSWQEVLA